MFATIRMDPKISGIVISKSIPYLKYEINANMYQVNPQNDILSWNISKTFYYETFSPAFKLARFLLYLPRKL